MNNQINPKKACLGNLSRKCGENGEKCPDYDECLNISMGIAIKDEIRG